jgi:hypothetical protein
MKSDWYKQRTLRIKKVLDFIASCPDGATQKDFQKAGLTPYGIERLVKLQQVTATQIREPERGSRCYHWLWKLNRSEVA